MRRPVQPLEWSKLGQVFSVSSSWTFSHAQVPFAVLRNGKVCVYVASRSMDRFDLPEASVTVVEIDEEDFPDFSRARIRRLSIADGYLGSFFENGAMPGSIARVDGKDFLYFTGWSRRVTVPYNLEIGALLVEDSSAVSHLVHPGPLLSKAWNDPFTQAHPIVFRHNGMYMMVYQSGFGWLPRDSSQEILYRLRLATSVDGLAWDRSDSFAVPTTLDNECQTSPTILQVGDLYLMYFAYRAPTHFRDGGRNAYRLGAAISEDLRSWTRISDPSLPESRADDWDSQMVTYPRFFQTKKGVFLFYCGNGFGKFGFGLAQLSTSQQEISRVIV